MKYSNEWWARYDEVEAKYGNHHEPECGITAHRMEEEVPNAGQCCCYALRACEARVRKDGINAVVAAQVNSFQRGMQSDLIRREFLKLLTQDSETRDMRRKEYNQAIFNPEGWAVFNGTDLNMVMDKFDHAVKNLDKRTPPTV